MRLAHRAHGRRGDLTIQEVMAEPMVQELMRADHVDPAAFEMLLRSVAAGSPGGVVETGRRPVRAAWFRSVKHWAASVKLAPCRW